MKKLFVTAAVVATAFLTGCASNGYVQQPQPQAQQQQPIVIQQAQKKQQWFFDGATLANAKDGTACKVTFTNKAETVFEGTNCADLMAKFQNGSENGDANEETVKVIHVNAPAQQGAASQQVVVAAPSQSFWDIPLIRGIAGALGGAVTGVLVSDIAGGDKDDRKTAGFAGAVTGTVIGVSSAPSSGGQQVVTPGYGGGYPQMMSQQYYGGYNYMSPDRVYLDYKAAQLQHAAQVNTFNFNNCGKVYGYYSPVCQR